MKVGDRVKIINERYTREDACKTGTLIQMDLWDKKEQKGLAFVMLDNPRRIYNCNMDHLEKVEENLSETIGLFE